MHWKSKLAAHQHSIIVLRFEVSGNKLKTIKKIKFSLWQAVKAQALLYFKLGNRKRWVANSMPRPFTREKEKLGAPSWAVWTGAASGTSIGVGTPDRSYTK